MIVFLFQYKIEKKIDSDAEEDDDDDDDFGGGPSKKVDDDPVARKFLGYFRFRLANELSIFLSKHCSYIVTYSGLVADHQKKLMTTLLLVTFRLLRFPV